MEGWPLGRRRPSTSESTVRIAHDSRSRISTFGSTDNPVTWLSLQECHPEFQTLEFLEKVVDLELQNLVAQGLGLEALGWRSGLNRFLRHGLVSHRTVLVRRLDGGIRRHFSAFFGAATARLGASLAVLGLVLRALGGAGIASIGARAADGRS